MITKFLFYLQLQSKKFRFDFWGATWEPDFP